MLGKKIANWAVLVGLWFIASSALADTTTFVCSYSKMTDDVKGLQKADGFVLTIIVDDESGKAYMVGNNGSNPLLIVSGAEYDALTFLERTTVGNVMTATIAPGGASVHSRHTVVAGKLTPSQYYGKCEVK